MPCINPSLSEIQIVLLHTWYLMLFCRRAQVMAAATPVFGAPAGRTSASPAPNPVLKSGSAARVSGSSIEETEKLLSKLREYVESKGAGVRAAAVSNAL